MTTDEELAEIFSLVCAQLFLLAHTPDEQLATLRAKLSQKYHERAFDEVMALARQVKTWLPACIGDTLTHSLWPKDGGSCG